MSKNLYLVIGDRGAGKTDVVDCVCAKRGLDKVKPYTTRVKTSENENNYEFITDEEVHGFPHTIVGSYMTKDDSICILTQEQIDKADLYIVGMNEVDFFKNQYTGSRTVKAIYIYTSPCLRLQRLFERTNKMYSQEIEGNERLTAEQEQGIKRKYADIAINQYVSDMRDYISIREFVDIVVNNNDSVEKCADEICKFIDECITREEEK